MLLAALALFAVVDLGETFSSKAAWTTNAVDFTAAHLADGFDFASARRDVVTCHRRGAAVWRGREVWETRIAFASDAGPTRVEMSLYNRGDRRGDESYPQERVDELLSELQTAFGGGAKPPKSTREKLAAGGFRCGCAWTKCDPRVELVWGVGAKGDIRDVRVTLSPSSAGATRSVTGSVASAKAKANVRRDAGGDVWIDGVPMVDQGRKGYCAAAVAERVLRYFGHDVDEHELAQRSDSKARDGTRTVDMIETVKSVGAKRRLAFEKIVSLEAPSDGVDPDELRRRRTKDPRFRKFLSDVRTQVDRGIPVCWCVTLGLFPESGMSFQSQGGHVRLIIGYNSKTREILYTDTWGAGHELKRMPEDLAFAITGDAFFLRPI